MISNFFSVHEEINSKMWYTLERVTQGCVPHFWVYFEWTEQKIVINPCKLIPNYFFSCSFLCCFVFTRHCIDVFRNDFDTFSKRFKCTIELSIIWKTKKCLFLYKTKDTRIISTKSKLHFPLSFTSVLGC